MRPFLSIVLTGRNDDHGDDFRTRFFRTLTFNIRALDAAQIPYEIVFVEWAPVAHRPSLVDLVASDVPGVTPKNFVGYVVDPRYQQALTLNPRLEYLEFAAKNVGIRRARGLFVLATNCDVFLSRAIVDRFRGRTLEVRTLYRAPRYDLKRALDYSRVDWTLLEDAANLEFPPPVLKPPLFAGGTGDFVLLDRDTFHRLRGFNEVYRVARAGVDANLLAKAAAAGVPIADIGAPVYHASHEGSYRLNRTAYAGREHEAPWGNIRWHSRHVVYENPDDWGLAGAPQSTGPDRVHRLEFRWDAVAPLVDLGRLILAAPEIEPPADLGVPRP